MLIYVAIIITVSIKQYPENEQYREVEHFSVIFIRCMPVHMRKTAVTR